MMKLVLATRNEGKVEELRSLLASTGIEVVSLSSYPQEPEVVEDGATFYENAVKKAREIAAAVGEITLADDSGLEVDYLNGAPGVLSARFAGAGHNDAENNKKLLQLMDGVPEPERTARFKCVIAVATPTGKVATSQGTCEGIITSASRGDMGFGYDPIFLVPGYNKTFAELAGEQKNAISHRGRALARVRSILAELLEA